MKTGALVTGDPLSLTLIRHACQNLTWEDRGGECRIKGRIVTG